MNARGGSIEAGGTDCRPRRVDGSCNAGESGVGSRGNGGAVGRMPLRAMAAGVWRAAPPAPPRDFRYFAAEPRLGPWAFLP
jgi:hypothetical protein